MLSKTARVYLGFIEFCEGNLCDLVCLVYLDR